MSIEERVQSALAKEAETISAPTLAPQVTQRARVRRTALLGLSSVMVIFLSVATIFGVRAITEQQFAQDSSPSADPSVPQGPQGKVFAFDSGEFGAARVLIIDAEKGEIVESLEVPGALSMAVAPDGRSAYVVSGRGGDGSSQAQLLKLDIRSGQATTLDGFSHPYSSLGAGHMSPLVTSDDGRYVHILRVDSTGRSYSTMAFDTLTKSFLDGPVEFGACGPVAFLPDGDSPSAHVVCSETNDVKSVFYGPNESGYESLSLPSVDDVRSDDFGNSDNYGHLGGGDISSEGLIYAVTLNGHVFVIDPQSRGLIREEDLEVPDQMFVAAGVKVINDKLYIGTGALEGNDLAYADHIVLVDTVTWDIVRQMGMQIPISNLEAGPGPDRLSVVNPEDSVVKLIDASSLEEVATVRASSGRYLEGLEVPELGQE